MRAATAWIAGWLLAVPAVAGVAGQGGYRTYSPEGTVATDPGPVEAHVDPAAAVAGATSGVYDNAASLVARVVTHAELIVRKPVPADATNVQRQQAADEKRKYLLATVAPLAGKGVSLSLEVLDVVRRPAPVPPPRPEPSASPEALKQYAADAERYDREVAIYGTAPMMVIGRLPWSSPTVLGNDYRRAVADAKDEASHPTTPSDPARPSEARRASAESLKTKLAALRQRADADRPIQMVYLLGSNGSFATWKRGQTRSAKGVVQRAAAYVYPAGRHADTTRPADLSPDEDAAGAYVGLELVLIAAPDAG